MIVFGVALLDLLSMDIFPFMESQSAQPAHSFEFRIIIKCTI